MKNLTIVNRYYPPNEGITGESAWDLAKYLTEKYEAKVRIVHVRRDDEGGANKRTPVGKTYSIPSIYEGQNPLLKNISSLLEDFLLIVYSLFVKKGVVIVMTSPPLLPMVASLFYKLFGVKWILWSMDLFPEGFVSNDTFNEKGLLYKSLHSLTYKFSPSGIIALGPSQKRFLTQKYKKQIEGIILPCGVILNKNKSVETPLWFEEGKITFGYCGNLGRAHSLQFVKSFIDRLSPERHNFILAVYGYHSEAIKDFCKNKSFVKIVESVDRSQLSFIDVHLVSLIKKWTHIAVPSKALSSIMAGSAIVFNGLPESDNWTLLGEAGFLVDASEDLDLELDQLLLQLTPENIEVKKQKAASLSNSLIENVNIAYDRIYEMM